MIGTDLVDTANFSYHSGSLSPTQKQGIITLLFKKGDQLDPKNRRPITLLCVDYKIIARALAKRLPLVISQVISPDQTCGIPGRFIGENIDLLRDIIEYTSSNNIPAALFSLDQEKAFDHVEWSFLHRVLTTMGFGPSFCCWIKLLYTDIRSSVQVNGYLSGFFTVSRRHFDGSLVVHLVHNPVPLDVSKFTAAVAYRAISQKELPQPRCEIKHPHYNWLSVWETINLCKFIRPTLDTAWKMAHSVLPVADRLNRFGIQASPFCFCGNTETIDHLFYTGPVASRLWFWFSSLVQRYRSDFPPLSFNNICFGFTRTAAVPKGFQLLMHIIKHYLWLHRNKIRFENTSTNAKEVLEAVKSTFRLALKV